MPQMITPRVDWNNLSDNGGSVHNSIEECRAECEAQIDFVQYSFDGNGQCKTCSEPKLGSPQSGITAGWIENRVAAFAQNMAACGDETWLT